MGRCFGLTRTFRRCQREGDWRLYCHDHKYQQPIAGVLGFIALIGTFASIHSAWFSGPQGIFEQDLSFMERQASELFASIGLEGEGGLAESESSSLWAIAVSDYSLRRRIAEDALASPGNAARFNRSRDAMLVGLVGISPDLSARLFADVVQPKCFNRNLKDSEIIRACATLIAELVPASKEAARALLELMQPQLDPDQLLYIAQALGALGEHIDPSIADEAALRIASVARMSFDHVPGPNWSPISESLGLCMAALSKQMSRNGMERAARQVGLLEEAVGSGLNGLYQVQYLVNVLAPLEAGLGGELRNRLAEKIVTLMEKHPWNQAPSLTESLVDLGGTVDSDLVARAGRRIVGFMETASDPQQLVNLGSVLAKLDHPSSKRQGALQILKQTSLDPRFALVQVFGALVGDANPDLVSEFVRRILKRIESHASLAQEDRPFLAALIRLRPQLSDVLTLELKSQVDALHWPSGPPRRWLDLARCLASLGVLPSDLAPEFARRLVETVPRGATGRDLDGVVALLTSLNVSSEGVDELASRIGRTIESLPEFLEVQRLARHLGTLRAKISDGAVDSISRRILARMRYETDHARLRSLNYALEHMADRLPVAVADEAALVIVAMLGKMDFLPAMFYLADGLGPLGPHLEEAAAERAVEAAFRLMERTKDRTAIPRLAHVLQSAALRLNPNVAAENLRRLYGLLKKESWPPCSAAASLVVPQTVPIAIQILKWPTCGRQDRVILIQRIMQSQDATIATPANANGIVELRTWELIDWASRSGYDVISLPQ